MPPSKKRSWIPYLPLQPGAVSGVVSNRAFDRLADELLRMIFRFTTEIPGGYGSSLSTPFDNSEIQTGYLAFQRSLNAAHRDKRNLCQVSRKFAGITKELMLEYLFLRDIDGTGSTFDWYTLAPALEGSRDSEEKLGRRGAGWYVKRLEIFTNVVIPKRVSGNQLPREDIVDKIDAAAKILTCCPKVRMLSLGFYAPDGPIDAGVIEEVNNDGEQQLPQQNAQAQDPNHVDVGVLPNLNELIPYPIYSALFTSPTSNINRFHLRRLEWTSDIVPATNLLFTYLPELSNLEFLHITLIKIYYPDTAAANIILLELHTLEIISELDPSSLLCLVATWKIDKFRRFGLTTTSDLSNPLPFYRFHGHKLHIHTSSFLGSETGTEILSLCTSLSDMIIHLRWAPLHVNGLRSNTVKRIGIRDVHFREVGFLSQDAEHLFACFHLLTRPLDIVDVVNHEDRPPSEFSHTFPSRASDLDDQLIVLPGVVESPPLVSAVPRVRPRFFPQLHTVRLLDFSPALFKERKWRSTQIVSWAFWTKRFERLNIRLEDHEGKLIEIVFSEVNVLLPEDQQYWWRYR